MDYPILKTTLSPATLGDIPGIRRVAELSWPVAYAAVISEEQIRYMLDRMYSEEALLQQMTEQQHQFLVLKAAGVLLGFCSIGLTAENKVYKLHKLYLLSELKGMGFGAQLLKAAEMAARVLGAFKLILNVNRANPTYQFYLKQGYRVQQTIDIPYGPYVLNDYIMEKTLYKLASPNQSED
jgi:GNAT superfamily N-acetyltransferase